MLSFRRIEWLSVLSAPFGACISAFCCSDSEAADVAVLGWSHLGMHSTVLELIVSAKLRRNNLLKLSIRPLSLVGTYLASFVLDCLFDFKGQSFVMHSTKPSP